MECGLPLCGYIAVHIRLPIPQLGDFQHFDSVLDVGLQNTYWFYLICFQGHEDPFEPAIPTISPMRHTVVIFTTIKGTVRKAGTGTPFAFLISYYVEHYVFGPGPGSAC